MMKTITALSSRGAQRETVHIGKRKDFGRRVCELEELTARRAFEIFERKGKTHGHDREDWLEAQAELFAELPGKLIEGEFSLEWQAKIGGFHARDLEIHVDPRTLVILGRKITEHPGPHGASVAHQNQEKEIYRVVELPVEVDPVMVTANIQNGSLEVFLLKARDRREGIDRAAA
jgi:HSP20 family molecular chaperone IbpA